MQRLYRKPKNDKNFNKTSNHFNHNTFIQIGGFKTFASYHADFEWQERFRDHIIRDADSFERIQNYVENKMTNWKADKFIIQQKNDPENYCL